MKVYARQVNPEYQESPILDCLPDDIALMGNPHYQEHTPDAFRRVIDALRAGELDEALNDVITGIEYPLYQYATEAEAVVDFLPPEGREEYTPEEVENLVEAVQMYASARNTATCYKALLQVLAIVTGAEWENHTLRGCCQSDWQEVFYRVDCWSPAALDALEVEYFNTGSEWIVQDDGETPARPEAVEGYSLYCIGSDVDAIRQEIADNAGCDPADVVLYQWAGVKKIDQYKEV